MNVLVIGDSQIPFEHNQYADFCKAVHDKYKCKKVVHIGDILDCYNWSSYDKGPEAPSPTQEIRLVHACFKRWGKLFPNVEAIVGNHNNRVRTRLKNAGFPEWSLPFEEVLRKVYKIPKGWKLHDELTIDTKLGPVTFMHGDERGGSRVPGKTAQLYGSSVVRGHMHSKSYVTYHSLKKALIYDMVVGCGIDKKSVAFNYSKKDILRPILSAGVIVDGIPHIVPMLVNSTGRWNGKI